MTATTTEQDAGGPGLKTVVTASAAGTALLAGRQAVSADAVRAVREDW